MSQTTAAPATTRVAPVALAPIALAAAMLAAAAGAVGAQASAEPKSIRSRFEFVVSSGALLPTGDQRDALKSAKMTLAQLSYAMRPYLAVTASMGWARSRDIATTNEPKLDVFTYDVGAELRADRWLSGSRLTFTPFAGAGAGGYNYRTLEVDATHNLAAYGSAGGELGYRRIRFRLEARDYLTGFKPLLANGAPARRNDVSVMAGFRITAH
jgi:Outer membrane protein beta-barrel domain